MKKHLKYPQVLFWALIPVILLIGSIQSSKNITLHVYDTYLVISLLLFSFLVAVVFGFIGFGYWISKKNNLKLSFWLSTIHVLVTIGGLLLIWLISLLKKRLSPSLSFDNLEYNQNLEFLLFTIGLIIILGQLVYPVNIARGILLKNLS